MKCKYCDNDIVYLGKQLCQKHYDQFRWHGKILSDEEIQQHNEFNNIILKPEESIALIELKSQKNLNYAIIDIEDVDRVKQTPYKWLFIQGYVVRNILKPRHLHNFILNRVPERGIHCDHINQNTLDNRKINLRIATTQQNAFNCGPGINNKSGQRGVGWNKRTQKWRARIKVGGKEINLGYYENIGEAIKIRRKAEKKYFGEFAPKYEDENDTN